jgi:hypothetical protein
VRKVTLSVAAVYRGRRGGGARGHGSGGVHGRLVGAPSRAPLERFLFLDDADSRLVAKRWDRSQPGRVRVAVGHRAVARRVSGRPDRCARRGLRLGRRAGRSRHRSWLSGYLDRRMTRFEHVAKITTTYGYRELAVVEVEFVQWLNDRAWSRRGRGGGGALSQSGEATRRLSRLAAPRGRRAVFRGRRLGFSAYCLHCFIVLFDPRCSCRATSSCRADFNSRQGCSPVG